MKDKAEKNGHPSDGAAVSRVTLSDVIRDDGAPILVSVIVPIYNAYAYLRPAMDSILSQTLTQIELICVDDGSTDHSLDILREYQQTDKRIRIVTENNAGPARARNKGLRRARGEYIAFLDADDFYEPTLLQTLYRQAKEKDLDVACVNYDLYISRTACFRPHIPAERADLCVSGAVTGKQEHPDSLFQMIDSYVWNKLFRASFLREKGLAFPEDVRCFEDVYFITLALALAERICFEDRLLVHHRVYSEQTRNHTFRKYYAELPGMYLKIKEFLMHSGLYLPLCASYVNLTASRCYKVYNMLRIDAKYGFYTLLHGGMAEKLGWSEIPAAAYHSAEVCEFAASVQLYSYAQYISRLARGLHINFDSLRRWLDRKRKSRKTHRKPLGEKKSLWRRLLLFWQGKRGE